MTTRQRSGWRYLNWGLGLLVCSFAVTAEARAPGFGGPLVGFAQSLLDFLTATLGPVVFGIGLAVAAYGFFVGQREALQRGVYVIVGGVILFSIPSVIDFVSRAAR